MQEYRGSCVRRAPTAVIAAGPEMRSRDADWAGAAKGLEGDYITVAIRWRGRLSPLSSDRRTHLDVPVPSQQTTPTQFSSNLVSVSSRPSHERAEPQHFRYVSHSLLSNTRLSIPVLRLVHSVPVRTGMQTPSQTRATSVPPRTLDRSRIISTSVFNSATVVRP